MRSRRTSSTAQKRTGVHARPAAVVSGPMRRIALVLALMALALPARALAAPPPVPADWIGVAADGPLTADLAGRDGEWDRMRADRVGFVRTAFYWRSLQPTPDVTDLTSTDAVVLAAARRGLGGLPVVSGSPVWAAVDPGDIASPPKGTGAYAALLKTLVGRYGPAGTLWTEHPDVRARPIRVWQVW